MTMHGKNTGIAIADRDVTRWCHSVSSDMTQDVADGSAFDEPQGAKVFVLGLSDAKYSYEAREQGTPDSMRTLATAVADAEVGAPFTVALGGFVPGRPAQLGSVLSSKVALSSPVADVVGISGELQSDGPVGRGVVLSRKPAYETTPDNGPSVDFGGAATTLIHLHVPTNSRNGATTLRVQHSTDQSTWVDVYSKTVPAGGSLGEAVIVSQAVNRYVRLQVVLAGSNGSVTIRAAIARRS